MLRVILAFLLLWGPGSPTVSGPMSSETCEAIRSAIGWPTVDQLRQEQRRLDQAQQSTGAFPIIPSNAATCFE